MRRIRVYKLNLQCGTSLYSSSESNYTNTVNMDTIGSCISLLQPVARAHTGAPHFCSEKEGRNVVTDTGLKTRIYCEIRGDLFGGDKIKKHRVNSVCSFTWKNSPRPGLHSVTTLQLQYECNASLLWHFAGWVGLFIILPVVCWRIFFAVQYQQNQTASNMDASSGFWDMDCARTCSTLQHRSIKSADCVKSCRDVMIISMNSSVRNKNEFNRSQ